MKMTMKMMRAAVKVKRRARETNSRRDDLLLVPPEMPISVESL